MKRRITRHFANWRPVDYVIATVVPVALITAAFLIP